ncbi:hypothetical protein Q5499_25705 [Escherichia coli]|uniref:hypothetical protein n=1 Tax=Escherichia coli TaxID=562 RepID=UPI000D0B5C43|nr:hypothetical protein [Escherichia coli]HAF4329136.1 hypothetical protein [Salmonella enterica]MCH6531373.1 hypothetical protein [Escherichia coli]MCK2342506.1 hypothetical protein [Escherichia coli]MCK2388098.1 hypothetical protein [Escherichia coli]MCO5014618.1 hypothetical protein [Escherichia coli]
MNDFINECLSAPRINGMEEFFSSTASGEKHKPFRLVEIDERLFHSYDYIKFGKNLTKNSGPFVNHYFCSIPYSKEEECRLGTTVIKYATTLNKKLNAWCLGMAEGAMARTISELSKGNIQTLTTSPTKENEHAFFNYGSSENAYFICTPFFLLEEKLKKSNLNQFNQGFDIIIEDTTFQMYSPNRSGQINHVKRLLNNDGIFIFTEKHSSEHDEYQKREIQKDYSFKQRYFSKDEINTKKEIVLNTMNLNEVSVDDMISAIKQHFKYASIYWNSGNFYSIAASNSLKHISTFINLLPKAAIPMEYVYEKLPRNISW